MEQLGEARGGPEPGSDDLVRPVFSLRPAEEALPPSWDDPPAPAPGDAPAGVDTPAADAHGPSPAGPDAVRAPARPRLTVHLRCAWCHDLLGAGRDTTCPGCGTRLHVDCLRENQRCPTLGCDRPARTRRWRWPWDVRARGPRSGTVEPSASRRAARLLGGFLLPVLCFAVNEWISKGHHPLVPEAQVDSGLGWVCDARVQRGLYPALVWALWAFLASHRRDQRSRWVRAGLEGGVALAALYSLVYLPLLPLSALAIVFFGLGLLGFGPYVALASFLGALRRDRQAVSTDELGGLALPRTLFGLLTGAGLAVGVRTALDLHAALPTHHHNCFVASAAARGDARVTGAVPVRGPDGVLRPVTRQLRTLKAFELLLVAASPRAHRALRAVYDRLGPPVARRLGPRSGALAWAALLPAQALARLALGLALRDADRLIGRTYPER